MKTKNLLLISAMLLMSMCIFAQSNMLGATSSWKNIVLNSDLEGNDVSCFFKTENFEEDEETIPATIISGAGKDNSRGIVVQSVDDPAEYWITQFFVRLPIALPAGTKYRMSFDYKASQDADVNMEVQGEPHDFIYWGLGNMTFTPSWQHFECEGIVTGDMSHEDNMMRSIAFDLAYEKTATLYYFDNIVFEIDQAQLEEPSVTISADDMTYVEDESEVSVKKGKTVTLKAFVCPLTLEDRSVIWESSDESIATVSSSGVVKGIKYGDALITCTSNATGLSATCKVTVASISLSKKEISINKGKTVTLKPTVYPTTLEDKSVTWKSSDVKIATVSSAGKVKGIKTGTATITCTSNATGLSATCTVNVNIDFADANVKAICVNYWDTNEDGELSPAEAAAVTDLGDVFQDNHEITSFNELQYFTGITEINRAFNDCIELTSIVIPSGVTSFLWEGFSFANLPSLKHLSVDPANSVYDSRNDCNAIIETATNKLVVGCETTQIPDGITTIGSCSFWGRWGMQEMAIPATVTTIEHDAFQWCFMTSVILPASIKTIDSGAFDNTDLVDVWCYAKTPVTITADVFTTRANATLHVPAGYKAAYAAADYWKEFKVITDGTEEVSTWKNIVLNSDLEGDDVSCFFKTENLAEDDEIIPATITDGAGIDNSRGLVIQSVNDPVETWNTQFFVRLPQALPVGTKYRMSFDYKASKDAQIGTEVQCEPHEYMTFNWGYGWDHGGRYGGLDFTPSTSWQHFEYEGIVNKEMSTDENMMRTIAFDLAHEPSATLYYFDNIVFEIDQAQWEQPSVTIATEYMTNVEDLSEIIVRKNNTMDLEAIVCPLSLKDRSVIWESSDESIATVSSDGVVKGVKSGVVTITCTSVFTDLSATCQVTVGDGDVTLNKSEAILEKGKTMTLKATVFSEIEDKSVTWKSSNTAVATVSSKGKVKGVKAGTATITCTSKATGAKATCKVTVSYVKLDKSEDILEKGKTMTLTSTVYPSKSTDQSVTWKSSNTAVATVTSTGKVKGVKAGTAVITCTSVATGLSTTCTVTVSYVKLDKSEAVLEKGKTMTLTPTVYPSKSTDQSVTWKSSNTTVATVTSTGKVKGVKAGTAVITCTSVATGLSTTCTVTVSYVKLNISEVTINKGNTMTLTSTVYPSKSTDQSVTWKSSDKTIATVTSAGKVRGVKAGTATITCTSVATGLSTTCKVTVTESASVRTMDGVDAELTDIEIVEVAPAVEEPFDVFDLRGHKVRQGVTSLDGLPAGVYIVNGKKILKK